MTNQAKQQCRDLYNRLRIQALQPGESLAIAWYEYDGEKRRLVTHQERLMKWRAS
jgi:hypothetical protein